ncbi:hypothetical protein OB920_13285 [Halobacteria archaeon HArc-gm2]|nr:hypothetical protein [Halobacteria archaeon HArc-gm2]
MREILQIRWFVDYVPEWLGAFLLAVGLALSVVVFWIISFWKTNFDNDELEYWYSSILAMVGAGFLSLYLYLNQTFLFAAALLLTGRWIEGVAATRFVGRVLVFLSDKQQEGSAINRFIRRRLNHLFWLVLTVIISGWLAVYVLILGYREAPSTYQLALVWTIVVGSMSVFALVWKFRRVFKAKYYEITASSIDSSTNTTLIAIIITGLILAVVGAELYNFRILTVETTIQGLDIGIDPIEIGLLILGNICYIGGFVWATKKILK